MKNYLFGAFVACGALIAMPASATAVIDGNCASVSASAGCLFDGNINSSNSGGNSYILAQNAYNLYNNSHPSANPDIFLSVLASSNDPNFASYGSFTGAGTASGTWTLSGYVVDYVAVKASNGFVLYKLDTPASTGSWDTFDIPFNNNAHGLSHLVFFGSARVGSVPEPSSWAMMLLGFGGIGVSLRRRRRTENIAQMA